MSSWATCGQRPADADDEHAAAAEEQPASGDGADDDALSTHAAREEVGLCVKDLLNEGRAAVLRQAGFRAQLVSYVGRDASLENVALIAATSTSD
jgi:hypothetical protein